MRLAWPIWVSALWWSSLGVVGFVVVPVLFAHLPSPTMAGHLAARLFEIQCLGAAVLGVVLLIAGRRPDHLLGRRVATASPLIVAGVLLALLLQFGVAPRIVARENLQLWHGLGTLLYVMQWLCAGGVFWRLIRPDSADHG